jgi:serine/threonine-protein kinase RsbW
MPMTENHWTWTCEQNIASETASGREVVDKLLEALARHEWEEHDVFGVHLAVEEALVNAIKHGNQLDASKTVKVVCKVNRDRTWIEIEDEGRGFDPDDVPDPTDEANLEIPSGRGLMLMRSYMSDVTFNDIGNRVVMQKTRTPPGAGDDDDDDDEDDD